MARYKLKIIVLVFNNNGIYGGKFEGDPGTAFPEVKRDGGEGRRKEGREGGRQRDGFQAAQSQITPSLALWPILAHY